MPIYKWDNSIFLLRISSKTKLSFFFMYIQNTKDIKLRNMKSKRIVSLCKEVEIKYVYVVRVLLCFCLFIVWWISVRCVLGACVRACEKGETKGTYVRNDKIHLI